MAKQPIDIEIMGRAFSVTCTDEERDVIVQAVGYLDGKMREIRDAGKMVSVERIAIMAALNITHELLNTRSAGVDVGDVKKRISTMQQQMDEVLSSQNKLL
ncbi:MULTISPECIES: cell division protein ZapA [unclassified Methylophilus]|jgi:cell division protein ZapA|uniref:cell division protein ZapA n=1 Tax=unclassified Methylophilus TaxID=2630143 RepID=UPI0006F313E9|nr:MULTISPECIES: cell division protein ZapA [unclassified Methylophilus]KQT36775.1 cell division protein ZapA [Methylophilus sp. Leaf414]KQT41134.1 cell division protein ZapA [Methylophilus sp. Leaf416]KQT58344.1 cell division protein ZapA [Methylophilus sp. Leaf459]